MRFVLIQGNNVRSAIELDSRWEDLNQQWSWTPPAGFQVVQSDVAGIGWTYDGVIFTPPPSNPTPPPTAEQLRTLSFVAQADRQDIISRLSTATPAQIDSWLTANVTNLAQARTVLGALIKVLCVNPPT